MADPSSSLAPGTPAVMTVGRRRAMVDVGFLDRTRGVAAAARAVAAADPYSLRVANFFTEDLDLLRALDRPRTVLWKMEFWGTETGGEQLPRSDGVDADAHVREMMSTGHDVIPYTFTAWGRDRLVSVAPTLGDHVVELLPIAQRPPAVPGQPFTLPGAADPGNVPLVGCGGLLHPAKGIEEVVAAFLDAYPDERAHLVCALVVEDDLTPADVLRRWSRELGGRDLSRVHVRTGPYGDWAWMCDFYRSVDVVLVGSRSDSWGRMVSEPLGFGVPTVVRRADCATNHLAPDLTLVDSFEGLGPDDFAAAVRQARAAAPRLAGFVRTQYALPLVRQRFGDLLTRRLPEDVRGDFLRHTERHAADLDDLVVY